MATSPVVQVSPAAVDATGLSVATAAPGLTDPRMGTAFDPLRYAAAAPVWFHPLADGRHLMASSRHWHDTTPVGGMPGAYSAYTEDTEPSWVVLDGPSGTRTPVAGAGLSVPTRTAVSDRVLVGGASRPPDFFWLLSSATQGPAAVALLQRFDVDRAGVVTPGPEEVLPSAVTGSAVVVFDKGLQYFTPFLHLYGTDSTGAVYVMRKSWARVGTNRSTDQRPDSSGTTPAWTFYTGTGFSTDATEAAPVPALSTVGPMSFGFYRKVVVATTVASSEGGYTGVFWHSRAGRPWAQAGDPVLLGTTESYIGGVRLMSQLGANPDVLGATVHAGIPYLITLASVADGLSRLDNSWSLHSVQL